MNQAAADVLKEASLIETRSLHLFPSYPSCMETKQGDVWYMDCVRCGRTVMMLPGAEHTIGSATAVEWCKLPPPSTTSNTKSDSSNSADKGEDNAEE